MTGADQPLTADGTTKDRDKPSDADWTWQDDHSWWRADSWGNASSWKDIPDRPYLIHITFPSFDGATHKFDDYKYDVHQLRYQCGPNDYKFLAPKLIAQFQGALKDDFRNA